MLTLFVLPLILAFAPAAVWALRAGGPRRLWLLGAFALLALILAALVLSAVYSVPSVWRCSWGHLSCSPMPLSRWQAFSRGRFGPS